MSLNRLGRLCLFPKYFGRIRQEAVCKPVAHWYFGNNYPASLLPKYKYCILIGTVAIAFWWSSTQSTLAAAIAYKICAPSLAQLVRGLYGNLWPSPRPRPKTVLRDPVYFFANSCPMIPSAPCEARQFGHDVVVNGVHDFDG